MQLTASILTCVDETRVRIRMVEAAYVGPIGALARSVPAECSVRLAAFLELLGNVDPLMASWFKTGNTRKSALVSKLEPTPAALQVLQALLRKGMSRRDDATRSVMTDLGFLVAMWNGQDTEIGLMISCGAAPSTTAISNSASVDLPEPDGPGLGLYGREKAVLVVRAAVDAWSPSWATWTNHRSRRAQQAKPGEVVVGWATYLDSARSALVRHPPAGTATEQVGSGTLITIGDDPTAVTESSVLEVRRALGTAIPP